MFVRGGIVVETIALKALQLGGQHQRFYHLLTEALRLY